MTQEAGKAATVSQSVSMIYQDTLHEPIAPDSEVFVLPQIAGG
jgi:molybdopterin converting factor small subunit